MANTLRQWWALIELEFELELLGHPNKHRMFVRQSEQVQLFID